MISRMIPCFALAAILASSQFSLAQTSESVEPLTRVGSYDSTYVVNTDGSFTETRGWSLTILKEQALAGAKQTSITYSRSIQKAEVLEAYTRKADGRRIDAPETNFQITVNSGKDKDAPVFSDQTTLTVVFPDVTVGDTVVLSYRVTAIEPMFPNHFSVWETFPRSQATDHVRVRVDVPKSLWISYHAPKMTEVQNVENEGRHLMEWTLENPKPIKNNRKDYSVYDPETEPGVFVSTFRSYGEIAAAYGARARLKATVTERIQKLADEIALGKKTPGETAQALYDWVSRNISYAGNCIGLGAVVPHDLDFVLDNRIGDCKDHATLLQALLAAEGIQSTQALVNASNIYGLPKIPVASMVNHVITYIPRLEMYADSTSDVTPFGMLPFQDAGKPVLLVDGYVEGSKTPVQPLDANEQRMKSTVKIKPDGSLEGEVKVALKGQFAVTFRAAVRNLPHEAEADAVKNFLRASGYIGNGHFAKDDGKELTDTYHYSATFNVKNGLVLPGAGAFPISPMIFNEYPIAHFVSTAVQWAEESADTACSSGRSVEEYIYEFPKGMKIISVPESVTLANDFLSYRATYTKKGNTLTAKRELIDRTKGNVCSPAVAAAYKDFALKVMPNIKAQVVFR